MANAGPGADWDYLFESMLNPRGSPFGSFRVNLGGGWHVPAMDCGSAYGRSSSSHQS